MRGPSVRLILGVALAVLALAAGLRADDDASPQHDHDLLMLRRQVEFQNKELQQLRTRHNELRHAVQQALATLKARPKETSDPVLIAALERALSASAPPGAAAADHAPGQGASPPSKEADAPEASPVPEPGQSAPPDMTPSPTDFRVQDFHFTRVAFRPGDGGATCTGRITNLSLRDDVVTAKFRLTTYDAKGGELEQATFFLAFAEAGETKEFSVGVKQAPPTGRFKIERVDQ